MKRILGSLIVIALHLMPPYVFAQSEIVVPQARVESTPRATLSRSSLAIGLGLGVAAWAVREFEDDRRTARALDELPAAELIDLGDFYGAGGTLALTSIGLQALGRAFEKEALWNAGRDLSGSLLTSGAIVWSLKISINARRPNGGRHSFPSGHTATAFTAAPILSRHFGPAVGVPAYGLACLTGLARMEDRKHYLADVLAGAAIGIIVGRESSFHDRSWSLIAPPSLGIGVSFRF